MISDFAIRSDFLIHWTGKDIDQQFDADWYSQRKTTVRPNTEIAKAYIKRLRSVLQFGMWLTEEPEIEFESGNSRIVIPSTSKLCFTELKLSESRNHAKRYGRLGIGVKRPYLFKRSGRPLAYYGFHNATHNDAFLKQCASDLSDKTMLNFFKPMNSTNDLNYDLYSESEWRILYFQDLLTRKLLIDPRDPANSREHAYFTSLSEAEQKKLKYLAPLDGWLSLIIYPSFWVKNMAKQESVYEIQSAIQRIKSNQADHANRVEGGNWPMEIDLDACRHF
jgi:hypothetical protein